MSRYCISTLSVFIVLFYGDGRSAHADERSRCAIPDISTYGEFQRTSEANTSGTVYTNDSQSDTTMTDYTRDAGGQWPLDLAAGDPETINCTIATPTGPYRIRIAITVNGQAFRTHQQAGVEAAISRAQATIERVEEGAAAVDPRAAAEVVADALTETVMRVQAETYRRSGVARRLVGYLKTLDPIPSDIASDDEELQWMISQWLPGGRVLVAAPGFGLQHSQTPGLLHLLAGPDLELSQDDIAVAAEKLIAADRDGNALVTQLEVTAAIQGDASQTMWPTGTLLNCETGEDPPDKLDLQLNLSFDKDGATCWLSDQSSGRDLNMKTGDAGKQLRTSTDFGVLEIVPVADQRTAVSPLRSGQFSIGAMLLPDPLWFFADTQKNSQLDMREIQRISERLLELDSDQNGIVTIREVPQRIRLVISQGPWANRLLTQLSTQQTPAVPVPPASSAPDWFLGMDVNQDQLLSISEFLGGEDRFREYDKDGDGILTVAEVSPTANTND